MTQKCQHDSCGCRHEESQMIHRDGKVYCSEACATNPQAAGCNCGHPDCAHGKQG